MSAPKLIIKKLGKEVFSINGTMEGHRVFFEKVPEKYMNDLDNYSFEVDNIDLEPEINPKDFITVTLEGFTTKP